MQNNQHKTIWNWLQKKEAFFKNECWQLVHDWSSAQSPSVPLTLITLLTFLCVTVSAYLFIHDCDDSTLGPLAKSLKSPKNRYASSIGTPDERSLSVSRIEPWTRNGPILSETKELPQLPNGKRQLTSLLAVF